MEPGQADIFGEVLFLKKQLNIKSITHIRSNYLVNKVVLIKFCPI